MLFENFFHSANALNVPSGPGTIATIKDLEATGAKWCALSWSYVGRTGDAGTKEHEAYKLFFFFSPLYKLFFLGVYAFFFSDTEEHKAYPQMEDEKEKKMCFSMAYMSAFLSALRCAVYLLLLVQKHTYCFTRRKCASLWPTCRRF